MAGLIQRHQLSSHICSVLLLALAILWADTESAEVTMVTNMTNEIDSTSEITALTTEIMYDTSTAATTTTTMVSTATMRTRTSTPTDDGRNDRDSGSSEGTKESPTKRIGAMAIAGLCLVIVALLLIAVNGYVLFRTKIKSCSARSGIFHVLPMSAIKKGSVNEDDVEDNFKEDADEANKTDSSTSLTKETPADQAAEQNGEVHVKVEVSYTAGSSATKDDDGDAKKEEENKDSGDTAAAAVDNESDKPGEEEEKKNETVVAVTVESGKENQSEP